MSREIERISKATGEIIKINNAYKFCDLRPFFGIAYQEYISEYDFWGYCDIDLVFGDIRKFLTDKVLDKYERFYEWGHLSVFKNIDRMNHLYDLSGGIYSKDEIFRGIVKTTPEEYHGINRICKLNNIKWYTKPDYADFVVYYSDLQLWHGYNNYEQQVFYWENGHVYRAGICENTVKTDEFVYLHWQKRKPIPDDDTYNSESFYITSGQFIKKQKTGVPPKDEIKKMCPKIDKCIRKIEEKEYIKNKLKEFATSSISQKKIWMRQKWYYFMESRSIVEKGNSTK